MVNPLHAPMASTGESNIFLRFPRGRESRKVALPTLSFRFLRVENDLVIFERMYEAAGRYCLMWVWGFPDAGVSHGRPCHPDIPRFTFGLQAAQKPGPFTSVSCRVLEKNMTHLGSRQCPSP